MFMLYSLLVGVALGFAFGGGVAGLSRIEFRWAPAAIMGLLAQLALFSPPLVGIVGDLGPPLYVGTTLLVVAVVLRNVAVSRALALVAAGALSNMAAILANGGYMPATREAMAAAGHLPVTGYSNSVELTHPALDALIDRFAMPAAMPLANVFSIGDVLIGIGIAGVIALAMRGSRAAPRIEPPQ
jgi:hypothetical protein